MTNNHTSIVFPCLLCNKKVNYTDKLSTLFCDHHSKYTIENTLQKKCIECGSLAMFNAIGLSPIYCIYHKRDNMVNVYDEYSVLNNDFFKNTYLEYDKYVSSL